VGYCAAMPSAPSAGMQDSFQGLRKVHSVASAPLRGQDVHKPWAMAGPCILLVLGAMGLGHRRWTPGSSITLEVTLYLAQACCRLTEKVKSGCAWFGADGRGIYWVLHAAQAAQVASGEGMTTKHIDRQSWQVKEDMSLCCTLSGLDRYSARCRATQLQALFT